MTNSSSCGDISALLEKVANGWGGLYFDSRDYSASCCHTTSLEGRYKARLQYQDGSRESLKATLLHRLQTDVWRVPVYRFDQFAKDLVDLPLIDKSLIRNSPENFFDRRFANETVWCKSTSGTTGSPVKIFYEADFYFDQLLQTTAAIGSRASLSPTSEHPLHCIALTDNQACVNEIWLNPNGSVGPTIQLVIDERSPARIAHLLSLVQETCPTCVTLKPSILEALIHKSDGVDLWLGSCHHIICSGANLSTELKKNAQLRLGVPVLEAYGLTEFGMVASECSSHSGLHIDCDIYAEVVDVAGRPVPDGSVGNLVLSAVRNGAYPLLRYRTGDLAALASETCTCGMTSPRITKISGRSMAAFRLPSGAYFSPSRFNSLIEVFPIREFQITQTAESCFEIDVEPQTEMDPESISAIQSFILSQIEEPCQVRVVARQFDYRHKFERYRVSVAI